MNLRITAPCHETWDAMSPAAEGRHCAVCAKTVVDVGAMTSAQARIFLTKEAPRRLAQGEEICVRAPVDRQARLLRPGRRLLTNGMAAMLAMAMGTTMGGGTGLAAAETAPTPTEAPQAMGEIAPVKMGRVATPMMGAIACEVPPSLTMTVMQGARRVVIDVPTGERLIALLDQADAHLRMDLPLPVGEPDSVVTLRDGRTYALRSGRILTGSQGGLDDAQLVGRIQRLIAPCPLHE